MTTQQKEQERKCTGIIPENMWDNTLSVLRRVLREEKSDVTQVRMILQDIEKECKKREKLIPR